MTQLGAADADPGGRILGLDRSLTQLAKPARARERRMSAPFVLAVPSKGRLQENAEAFFARAGLSLAKPRGARDYRGTIAGLDHVEIAYLSASEIASQLARGAVHLGVTGEDLVRESIADADKRVLLIDRLGFGSANVVVAVPQAWIDVRTMADLDDVATGFRAQHNRADAGRDQIHQPDARASSPPTAWSTTASSKAPAPPKARRPPAPPRLIVDITTTGATLAANGLKVLDDGVILRSQANLVASREADWSARGPRDRARHPRSHRRARPRQQIPRGAHPLCRLQRRAARRGA